MEALEKYPNPFAPLPLCVFALKLSAKLQMSRQALVRAVAERAILGVLAAAPRDLFCFSDVHFQRCKARAFVRAVAEWLAF